MISPEIVNPYNISPELDLPHDPQTADNWTEYRYFFAYDPSLQVGISLHIGRIVEDREIWRGILYVFLPDGEILVRKYAGRAGDARSLGAGPLKITCIEPFQHWKLEFDGLLNSVSRASLCHKVASDGVDELVSFSLFLDAAAPLSILNPRVMKGLSWSRHHTEQIHSMRGELNFRGKKLALKGMGARDHSSGPRNSGVAIGSFWANILFPSGIAVNVNLARTKTFDFRTGYVYWGDGTPLEEIEILSAPEINDANTPDHSVVCDVMEETRQFQMRVMTSRGQLLIEAERLNTVSSTYIPPHHEFAGTDLSRIEGAQMTKTAALFKLNGEIGTGQLDRLVRISTLRRA